MEIEDKQLRKFRFSADRDTFVVLFVLFILTLLLYPFISTFNDLLTRFVIHVNIYTLIKVYIVPIQMRLVGVLLMPFGIAPRIAGEYLAIGNPPFLIEIAWNCIGWQSVFFFLLSGWVGFQGDKYTTSSKIKAWIIGLWGTIFVNIVRIALVCLAAYYLGQFVATVIHDYGSTIVSIGWLFFFWWFSYSHILEQRQSSE